MGGASVASPNENASVTISPATLALVPRYDFQGSFIGGPSGDLRWNVSAMDGRTSERVAFGLSYHGGILNRAFLPEEYPGWAPADETLINSYQRHDITLAMAVPVLDRRLSFGLNGTLSIREGEYVRSGVTGNMDFAVAARPVEEFTVAFVGSDLLPIENQVDRPARIALGLRGGKDELFSGAVDVGFRAEQVTTSPWWVAAGIEGAIKVVRLRAGWDWDGDRGTHRIAWGLGLVAPLGILSYGMQVPVITENFNFASVTHTVTLTIRTKLGDRENEDEGPRWNGDPR